MRRWFLSFIVAFIIACVSVATIGVGNAQAALVFHSGFEIGDFSEWSSVTGSAAISTSTEKTGTYSLRADVPLGGTGYVDSGLNTAKRISVWVRMWDAPSEQQILIGSSSAIHVRLSAGNLQLYDSSGQLGDTGLTSFGANWRRISVSYDGTNARLYLDGSLEVSPAATSDTYIDGTLGVQVTTTDVCDFFFDDYAADTTESAADLGDIRVELSQPNGEGHITQYDNPVPSATHYENVDNAPLDPNMDDDYNEIEATGEYWEFYHIEDASAIGLDGSDTINAVSTWARMKRNGGGGTDHMIVTRDLGLISYTTDLPLTTSYVWYNVYDADTPNGGAAWTQLRFNGFAVGGYRSTAQNQHISNMQVMVAYTPSVAEADISNAPTSKAFGVVASGTDYWSNGSAPTWPLDDGECYFTVTNNGDACSITIKATNFTGGVGWALAGSPGENIVTLKAAPSGTDLAVNMTTLTTGEQSFIDGLVTTKKWEVKVETPTSYTDGVLKESTITLTATLD